MSHPKSMKEPVDFILLCIYLRRVTLLQVWPTATRSRAEGWACVGGSSQGLMGGGWNWAQAIHRQDLLASKSVPDMETNPAQMGFLKGKQT